MEWNRLAGTGVADSSTYKIQDSAPSEKYVVRSRIRHFQWTQIATKPSCKSRNQRSWKQWQLCDRSRRRPEIVGNLDFALGVLPSEISVDSHVQCFFFWNLKFYFALFCCCIQHLIQIVHCCLSVDRMLRWSIQRANGQCRDHLVSSTRKYAINWREVQIIHCASLTRPLLFSYRR